MNSYCVNRLLIVGPTRDLNRFYRDNQWMGLGSERHFELMEHSPQRHVWQFDSDSAPLRFLRTISRQWPTLTFVLDYDCEDEHLKGLAKSRNSRVRHYQVTY